MELKLTIRERSWQLAKEFRISRGVRTSTEVLEIELALGEFRGKAEAVPYAHYGETLESVSKQISEVSQRLSADFDNKQLIQMMPAGAARNAVDCALWDLRAKQKTTAVNELLQLKSFTGSVTAQTLSIDTPEQMAQDASEMEQCALIKVKLDATDSLERMRAISKSAPKSRFIIDANEAWSIEQLRQYAPELAKLRVALIEQPLAANADDALIDFNCTVPLCADESIHTSKDLDKVAKRYQYINIKLDKTGGLTEAINLLNLAKQKSLGIMVGCMVGTSLSMAPASLIASYAEFVDLDGPTLLASDVEYGFDYQAGEMGPLKAQLWGSA